LSAEEVQMETQEVVMEDEVGQDTSMGTQMPEVYDPSDAQIKRPWEKASGIKKKEKTHINLMETSMISNDVELIATTMEDKLSEVCEIV
jgi:hypothetical protein